MRLQVLAARTMFQSLSQAAASESFGLHTKQIACKSCNPLDQTAMAETRFKQLPSRSAVTSQV